MAAVMVEKIYGESPRGGCRTKWPPTWWRKNGGYYRHAGNILEKSRLLMQNKLAAVEKIYGKKILMEVSVYKMAADTRWRQIYDKLKPGEKTGSQ